MGMVFRGVVVIVSHVCPFPQTHGNRRRILSFLRWLKARGFQVAFVLQPTDADHPRHYSELRDAVDELVVVSEREPPWVTLISLGDRVCRKLARVPQAIRRRLRGWLKRGDGASSEAAVTAKPLPTDMDTLCWYQTRRAVARLVRLRKPSVLISEYALFSRCFEGVPTGV